MRLPWLRCFEQTIHAFAQKQTTVYSFLEALLLVEEDQLLVDDRKSPDTKACMGYKANGTGVLNMFVSGVADVEDGGATTGPCQVVISGSSESQELSPPVVRWTLMASLYVAMTPIL